MSVDEEITRLKSELDGGKNAEVIADCERKIAENVENVINNDSFYQLPIANITNVVGQADFKKLSVDKLVTFLDKTNQAHPISSEEETLYLFYFLKRERLPVEQLTIDEIMKIFNCFKGVQLFEQFKTKYEEQSTAPLPDYQYIISNQETEIAQLKKEIQETQDKIDKLNNGTHIPRSRD